MKPWVRYFLSLSKKEQSAILSVLKKLEEGKFETLDMRKLSGFETLYRIRIGERRVIVEKESDGFKVVRISSR